jgi:hypothetical protein
VDVGHSVGTIAVILRSGPEAFWLVTTDAIWGRKRHSRARCFGLIGPRLARTLAPPASA